MTDRIEIPPVNPGGPYTPPPLYGEPRLYALLAVEAAPGHIVYFHLELDPHPGACVIDMDRGYPEAMFPGEVLSPSMYGRPRITAHLSGTVVSDRPDYRPPTRATPTAPPAIGGPS